VVGVVLFLGGGLLAARLADAGGFAVGALLSV